MLTLIVLHRLGLFVCTHTNFFHEKICIYIHILSKSDLLVIMSFYPHQQVLQVDKNSRIYYINVCNEINKNQFSYDMFVLTVLTLALRQVQILLMIYIYNFRHMLLVVSVNDNFISVHFHEVSSFVFRLSYESLIPLQEK